MMLFISSSGYCSSSFSLSSIGILLLFSCSFEFLKLFNTFVYCSSIFVLSSNPGSVASSSSSSFSSSLFLNPGNTVSSSSSSKAGISTFSSVVSSNPGNIVSSSSFSNPGNIASSSCSGFCIS